MPSLRDSAIVFKGKKELTDLDKIPVDIEFKTDKFKNAQGVDTPFNFIEIDGWKYTIKAKIMSQIQMVLASRPQTKFIKVQKAPNGDIYVMPLD